VRVSGWTVTSICRLPHRLHRRRRPSSPTVASPDPMIWIAALTLVGAAWPQPARPWQPANHQSEFSSGRSQRSCTVPSGPMASESISVIGAMTSARHLHSRPRRSRLEQRDIVLAPLAPGHKSRVMRRRWNENSTALPPSFRPRDDPVAWHDDSDCKGLTRRSAGAARPGRGCAASLAMLLGLISPPPHYRRSRGSLNFHRIP